MPAARLQRRCPVTGSRALLRPAILVLLREREDHGYALVERLGAAGLGTFDPPGIYRALRGLEEEGAARSWWTSAPRGAPRRVYALTGAGERSLRQALALLASQRDTVAGLVERGQIVTSLPAGDHGYRRTGDERRLAHPA